MGFHCGLFAVSPSKFFYGSPCWRNEQQQGLKAQIIDRTRAARLKPCPDTKRSFSAACEAQYWGVRVRHTRKPLLVAMVFIISSEPQADRDTAESHALIQKEFPAACEAQYWSVRVRHSRSRALIQNGVFPQPVKLILERTCAAQSKTIPMITEMLLDVVFITLGEPQAHGTRLKGAP